MRNNLKIILMVCGVCFLMACSNSDDVVESTKDLDGFNQIDDIKTGMNLRWKFSTSNITFEVSGRTTGWVAVGFEPTTKMKDANIIIGYVKNGVVVISDDYGNGTETHLEDLSSSGTSDISQVTGNETAGVTTIGFTIPQSSGDSHDKDLVKGMTYTVMLAKSSADDLTTAHASTVSGRTSFRLKL